MNKQYFNSKFNQIRSIIATIALLKKDVKNLEKEINEKKILLNEIFNKKINLSKQKEQKIKTLMDNRGFTFIKLIDFLDERDIETKQGFNINKNSGFLFSEILDKQKIQLFKKSINPSNKKEIIFEFDNSSYSNLLEFSFKTKEGTPLLQKIIRIEYNNLKEEFFEPNFRYYNRNAANIFVNNFYFYPKKILRIFVEFDTEPDFENSYCNLYTCIFNTDTNNFIDISIKNTSEIRNFNLYKNSDENNIPLIFEFTEDNIKYKLIDFKNQEGIISLENSTDFSLRIKKNFENVKTKIITEDKILNIAFKDMIIKNSIINFDFNGEIKKTEIIFSNLAYKKIKERFFTLFNNETKISEYIIEDKGKYKVKKEFVNLINSPTEEMKNMIFIDDFDSIKTSFFNLNFYIDKKDKKIYCSSFMHEFNFFLGLDVEIVTDKIAIELLTPFLFDLQLKG